MGEALFSGDLAPVMDLWPEMCAAPHTPETFGRKVAMLSELGFRRVYFVVPPPGYPMFSSPWLDVLPPDNDSGHFGLESIIKSGDACLATTIEAHRHGMEAFAILKPYEGGGGYTIPHGWRPPLPRNCITQLGGEGVGYDTFVAAHPEMRVERRPIADYERLVAQPITMIELSFCLDEVRQKTFGGRSLHYPAQGDEAVRAEPIRNVRLWTSRDNGRYAPYNGTVDVAETIERRAICDACGLAVYDEPKRCRVVRLQGLDLPDTVRYAAVSFDASGNDFVCIPYSMIKAFGPTGEMPITSTPQVRWQAESLAGGGRLPPPVDFQALGFEFDWSGSGYWAPGWQNRGVYGIARGKLHYMKGTPCEAYPEVRVYWLDQVDRLIAMGVDGVDIRLQNHSGAVSDYVSYGYNAPIVEEYRRQHGVDIVTENVDPLEIMRIRGELFMRFLDEAAGRLHSHNRRLQVHLRDCHEKARLSSDFGELGFWAMPKIRLDWERVVDLADEITIKDYNWGRYDPQRSGRTKSRAHDRKKPVWVHCYLHQGGDLTPSFAKAVQSDGRITGMLLYETGHIENPNLRNEGLLYVSPDGEVRFHEPILAALEPFAS